LISERLSKDLNIQLKNEYYSSYFYLAIASYFTSINLDGFEKFMITQAEEEQYHFMKFYNYLKMRGIKIEFYSLDAPRCEFTSPVDAFKVALEHERSVSQSIYKLMDIATVEKEYATVSFLKWFMDEQVEEESSFESWVAKLNQVGNAGAGLLMLSKEAGERNFVPDE
jgi:ferritin